MIKQVLLVLCITAMALLTACGQDSSNDTMESVKQGMQDAKDATADMVDEVTGDEGMLEQSGEAIDDAMDSAGDMIDDAGDSMSDMADDAADSMNDMADDAVDAMSDDGTMEEMGESADEMVEDAKKKMQ